jgi:hypothetical protein
VIAGILQSKLTNQVNVPHHPPQKSVMLTDNCPAVGVHGSLSADFSIKYHLLPGSIGYNFPFDLPSHLTVDELE